MNVARGVGVPLKIDKATLDGNFGTFARILIDVDLSKELLEYLMIERLGHKFFIGITYENLPDFYKNCCAISHSIATCKKNPFFEKF